MAEETARRGRGRPPAFEPDEALDAAVKLFWRHGFTRTDLDSVAAAVDATKPSLYRRFGDKRALFRQALERYAKTTGSAAMKAFSRHDDIAEAVRAFLETTVACTTDPAGPRGCMIACVAAEAAGTMPEIRAFCADMQARSLEAVTARFAEEVAKSRLADAPPPGTRAQMMIAAMQNIALRARAGEDRGTLRAGIGDSVTLLLAPADEPARPARPPPGPYGPASSGWR